MTCICRSAQAMSLSGKLEAPHRIPVMGCPVHEPKAGLDSLDDDGAGASLIGTGGENSGEFVGLSDDGLASEADAVKAAIKAALADGTIKPRPPFEALLVARKETHGAFYGNAKTAQAIKVIMVDTPNWGLVSDQEREALELIATKIARVLNGAPDALDSWRDIGGYAALIVSHLETRGA